MGGNLISDPYKQIVRGSSRQSQIDENASRYARFECKFITTGSQQKRFPDPVMFDCTFVDEPHVVTGLYCAGDDLEGASVFPRVSAGIYKFIASPQGYYTGAYVWFNVDVGIFDTFEIHHYFTFSGIAIKVLPAYLLDQ
jgi:hypothetical protein